MGERVLVVDDHPPMVKLIEDALGKEGFSVLSAQNGAEGLRVVATERPDLVILDVEMPVMDGFEVLRALRLKVATSSLPVIMLSVHKEPEDLLAGWIGGADQYLTKPCKMEDVVAAVRKGSRHLHATEPSSPGSAPLAVRAPASAAPLQPRVAHRFLVGSRTRAVKPSGDWERTTQFSAHCAQCGRGRRAVKLRDPTSTPLSSAAPSGSPTSGEMAGDALGGLPAAGNAISGQRPAGLGGRRHRHPSPASAFPRSRPLLQSRDLPRPDLHIKAQRQRHDAVEVHAQLTDEAGDEADRHCVRGHQWSEEARVPLPAGGQHALAGHSIHAIQHRLTSDPRRLPDGVAHLACRHRRAQAFQRAQHLGLQPPHAQQRGDFSCGCLPDHRRVPPYASALYGLSMAGPARPTRLPSCQRLDRVV